MNLNEAGGGMPVNKDRDEKSLSKEWLTVRNNVRQWYPTFGTGHLGSPDEHVESHTFTNISYTF